MQIVIGNDVLGEVGDAMGRLLTDLDLNAVLGIDPTECVIDTIFRIGWQHTQQAPAGACFFCAPRQLPLTATGQVNCEQPGTFRHRREAGGVPGQHGHEAVNHPRVAGGRRRHTRRLQLLHQ